MLGYCGVNCDACPAYRGTVTTSLELLEQAAGEYEQGTIAAEEWVCLGCTPADQPFLAKYCARCKIRACAIEKGIGNCAACDEYDACTRLHQFMESAELAQRMAWLRKRFVAGCQKL